MILRCGWPLSRGSSPTSTTKAAGRKGSPVRGPIATPASTCRRARRQSGGSKEDRAGRRLERQRHVAGSQVRDDRADDEALGEDPGRRGEKDRERGGGADDRAELAGGRAERPHER